MKRPMEFNIRIAATEKAGFKASAEAAGMTLSAWTRDRLRTAAARELRRVGKRAPFLRSTPQHVKKR
jgi:hypothetical protein